MKFIRGLLILGLSACCISTTFATTIKEKKILTINGEVIASNNDFYIEDDSIAIPVRAIAGILKANVNYDKDTKKVTLKNSDMKVEIQAGTSVMRINGSIRIFDAKPVIKNNITMLPLVFVNEILDVDVQYDKNSTIINLDTLKYNMPQDIISGYMMAIDLVYQKDEGLNSNIEYIAIDTTKMKYLSEANKQELLKMLEKYGCTIINGTYESLEMQGLIKEGHFEKGILISIDDTLSREEQLILSINKWRANLGAIGCSKIVLENADDNWQIVSTGKWVIS